MLSPTEYLIGRVRAERRNVVAHRLLGRFGIAVTNAIQYSRMLFTNAKVMIGCPQRYEPESKRLVVQASEELRQHAVPASPGDQSVECPIKIDEVAHVATFGGYPNSIEVRLHPSDFGTSCPFRGPAHRLSFIEEPHLNYRDEVIETDRRYDNALTWHDLDEAFNC